MVLGCCPTMRPHGRTASSHPPTKLPDQACGHGFAPILDGVEARNASLDPITTNLGNYITSLGRNRQARQDCVSSSPRGLGGDPVQTSLGCKPPYLEHFALGRGKAKQLELADAIHIVDVHMRACQRQTFNKKRDQTGRSQRGA